MRYAVFSDVHSNLEAFEAVLGALEKEKADKYLFAGDIVGYAADPCECIKKLRELVPAAVAGNHDWGAVGKTDITYFNEYAREAVRWTATVLGDSEKDYLAGLNLVYENEDVAMVHGTLDAPAAFNYIFDLYEAMPSITMLKRAACFVGHSHRPFIILADNCKPEFYHGQEVSVGEGKKYLVNVGSVGQPRDGDPRASYCIYDTDSKKIEIKRVPYDIKKAQQKILNAGLPPLLAYRLAEGR